MRRTSHSGVVAVLALGWSVACANPNPPTLNQKCFYDEDCDAGQYCAIGNEANDGLCRAAADDGGSSAGDTGLPGDGTGLTDGPTDTIDPSTTAPGGSTGEPIATSAPSGTNDDSTESASDESSRDESSSEDSTGGEPTCLGVPAPDTIDYAAPLMIDVTANPQGVAAGDLDLDDNLDLIVTSRDDGTATVFHGDSFGNFSPGETTNTGDFVGAVRIGAIADATPDIVVHQQVAGNVRRLQGAGNGSFGIVQTLGNCNGGLELIDVNGDDVLDLVTSVSGGVAIALGTVVAETFGAAVEYPTNTGSAANRIATADFDGNGTVDVVAGAGGQFVVMLGNGSGALVAQTPVAIGAIAGSITAGDFDSDGDPDVAVVSAGGGTDATRVFWGEGTGAFEPVESVLGTQSAPTGIRAADVDADGDADLLVTHAGGALGIHLSTGDGGFVPQQSFMCSGNLREIAIGDFNGDCVLDVASVSSGASLLCIWLSQ